MTDIPPGLIGSKTPDEIVREAQGRAAGGSTGPRPSRARTAPAAPLQPAPESAEGPPRKRTPANASLREGVLALYTSAEMIFYMFDQESASIISQAKDKCADSWIDLAEKDKKVKEILTKLTTGSAWGGVAFAHVPLVLPLLAKRGWFPGGALFGGHLMNAMHDAGSEDEERAAQAFFDQAEVLANQGFVPFTNGAG